MIREIETAVRELDPNNDKELKSLAQRIKEEGWENTRRVVSILRLGKQDESAKATLVLMSIGDLAATPLLDSINSDNPDNLARDMDIVISAQLENRSKIVKILNKMLLDKRTLRDREFPAKVEAIPPSRRVCDEAYIMMRNLFAFEEKEEELSANLAVFLDMPDEKRDIEILRAKKARKWVSLTERALEESE